MDAALIIWQKQMKKLLANGEEFMGMMIQPVLWVVLFGVGMTSLINPMMGGSKSSYISFMIPGIIALTALEGGISGGNIWLEERIRGIVKEYLVAPIPRISILIGNILSVVSKSLLQSIIIFIVGLFIGINVTGNFLDWIGSLILLIGFGMGFSGIALATASRVSNSGAYHMLIFILNLPMLFLSNALYPLNSLPRWMEIGARINPTTYLVSGLRKLVLSNKMVFSVGSIPLWQSFLFLIVFALLGIYFAYLGFKKSIQ